MDHYLSYHEVVPDQTNSECWKEISLNTGGTQSTLQDIKATERANGYSYKDASQFYTRNRFIYWHVNNDILELVEQSLDINLTGNNIRYKFVDTPILDGVTAHETLENVIILVPTVCSVHRLIFPHPSELHKQDELLGSHPDISVSSIFSEANSLQTRDPSTFYVFNHPTANSQLPHSAASILKDNDALFLLAYPTNEIILIRQFENGECETLELKSESIVPRFLAEIADKFRSKASDNNVVSMLLHNIENNTYAITLTRDGYLRVWCCTNALCITASDILLEINSKQFIQGAQNFMLKKSAGDEEELLIGIYINSTSESKFFVLELTMCTNACCFKNMTYLSPPCTDLVDFSFTSKQIWTMWRGKERECQVYSARVCTNIDHGVHWMPAILESIPDQQEVPYNSDYIDPKEAYLNYIFYPGRFPLSVINKALNIYKRSTILSDLNISTSVLKQRVCIAVENEIQSTLQECEVNDEDYLECANNCWRSFYSCCIQYHMTGLRPLGILLLPSVSGIVLLKRKMYSFLRPMDLLEHLILCSNHISGDQFMEFEEVFNSKSQVDDIIKLVNILTYMDNQLNDLFKILFEEEMEHLKSPEIVIKQLLSEIELDEVFTTSLQTNLNYIQNLEATLQNILRMLSMEFDENFEEEGSKMHESSSNHLFNSQLGISFTAEIFKQQAYYRFSLCRMLFSFLYTLLQKKSCDAVSEFIETVCMPELIALTRSYFVMYWFSKQSALPVLPLETAMQRLSPLKLNPVFNLRTNTMEIVPLLELFIGSTGGLQAHKTFLQTYTDDVYFLSQWHTSLLLYLMHIRKLIWPITGNPILPEWLLTSGQHLWLQQYVHLMNDWCETNGHTRNFLLAAAFLTSGEHHKAYDLFISSSIGLRESYISNKTQNTSAYVNTMYYLKVIHLFELHGGRDYVLELTNAALLTTSDDDPLMATLYSIKFKHHLALGHYELAYEALYANSDDERKKDNLRDLIKTLLDNKELNILMSLKYTTMETLFSNILFTRARACDSVENIFYDFLYCYQVKRGIPQMRLAGAIMYEQAFRLRHHNTIEALEKQVKCYLAAVNALSLCDPRYAWVLLPADPDIPEEVITLPVLAGSEDEPEVLRLKHKIDIVELKTIKLELALNSARLKLARFDPQYLTNALATPGEIVMYLTTVGLLQPALTLCSLFELPYDIVFEALTRQCILLTEYEDLDAWNWLIENNLHELPTLGNTPSSVTWQMLKTYLEEYEEDNMSILHKIICQKIIRMGGYIPHWLLASYKKRNPSELLRLYLFNGRLHDACQIAKEHLLAALGYGSDHFNIEHGVGPTTKAFCLPVNVIDALIFELNLQNEDEAQPVFTNEYKDLKELFLKYLDTTARISNEICRSGI